MNSLSLTCACHVIDPSKTPILVWIRKNKPLVKIANQMFIGSTRTDKKGATYWKCKDFSEEQTNSVDKSQLGTSINSN